MLNFTSLFNQFRSQVGSSMGDLLDQPGITMGKLLDEEAFLNEYKSGTPKITQFMKYERYEELIEFITVVGPPDDKKRSYKYPLSACEMLCIDNSNALEALFPDQPILRQEKVFDQVQEQIDEKIEEEVPSLTNQQIQTEKTETAQEQPLGKENEEKTTQQKQKTLPAQLTQQQLQKTQIEIEAEAGIKKYRKVKTIRKYERIVQKELPPLIGRLMGYFNGEINYTLAAYVSRVLSFIYNKKPTEFLNYFLQPKFTETMLNHSESRSVGELITRVLTHESQASIPQRKTFFTAMLAKLSQNSEIYIMSNISAYVVEIIEKASGNLKSASKVTEFADLFFSLEVVTQIIKNVMSEHENVSVYSSPVLLAFLTSMPFVVPEEVSVKSDFVELIEAFVERSCQKLNVKSQNHPKIGLGRIKIIQILRFLLKQNILNSREIVAKDDTFFTILLNLFREYPLSSLLHNQIVKIIEIALNQSETSPIFNALLKDNLFLNFIREEAIEDKKIRSGDSIYKSRKGFIAHLINIGAKMRELAQNNPVLRASIEGPEYSQIYQSFFQKEIFNSKKPLAGFLIKRDPKQHQLQFQKEDIIATYATFLRKCPPPIFEEPEPTPDSHPDLVEELQKQIQESLTIKHKQVEKHVEVQKTKEEKIQDMDGEDMKNFEESILSYDLDELGLDW